jgi:hypothetical protein
MLFRRNAYAGVHHREANSNFTARRIQPKSFDADVTFFCKYDGVSGKVDEYLA